MNNPKVYKEVISVDFVCSYYQRLAYIKRPELSDYVTQIRPLWTDGLNDIRLPGDRDLRTSPAKTDMIKLRWFDSGSGGQIEGILTLPVEISYTSKVLDRQSKLDELGVK